ncbi:LysE family translocator [Marinomonas sp. 2405UD68-3]|uniref:LysE family translocator n=1 Tax=Marinomonas sp. 2405UD68-3 TaxID=3391835 RepID=UPI0039C99D24
MEALSVFFFNCLALSALPGPNNILCLNYSVRKGMLATMVGCLGRFPPYLLLMSISALLLFSAVSIDKGILNYAQILGSLYMLWLGIKFLFSKAATVESGQDAFQQYFRQEFLTALSNPKAILVFLSIFPNFIYPSDNFFTKFALLGIIAMLAELTMAYSYAFFGSRFKGVTLISSNINRASGVIVLVIAFSLLIKAINEL